MSNVYEVVTQRIIQQLEQGVVPWHKPWNISGDAGVPRNLMTKRAYRGINVWILTSSSYISPFWLTYRQAQELGGHVRKGEEGSPVVFWKFGTREIEDGDEVVEHRTVLCRYYTVFNVEQCDGLEYPKPSSQRAEIDPIEACDQIVANWNDAPQIRHGGDRASYRKVTDLVSMPFTWAFESAEEYHSTLFHELVHSTGHPRRLNRSSLMESEYFGDDNYSREELVAEMGAAFLCGFTGIEQRTLKNSSSYIHNWLSALKADSRLLIVAASQAQKAVDLMLGRTALNG